MNSGWACKVFTSIIVINFFMMEMLKRVRWLALAPFMSVMITIPLMSSWSVHFWSRKNCHHIGCNVTTLTAVEMIIWQAHIRWLKLILAGLIFCGEELLMVIRGLCTQHLHLTHEHHPAFLVKARQGKVGAPTQYLLMVHSCKVWTLILKTNHQSLCVHQVSHHLSQRQVWIPVVKPFWTFALHCMEVVQLLLFSTLWTTLN